MDLYLIDYSNYSEKSTNKYEPEVDRLISLPPDLEKTAIDNGWITKGETIYIDIKNTIPKYENSVQIRFVDNQDGTRSPILIYNDKIISAKQTKKSSIRPDSIYKFLKRGTKGHVSQVKDIVNPNFVEERLEEHFDVRRLMAVASLSKTYLISKARRFRNRTRFNPKLSDILGVTEETYKLTPIANILRMGTDYSYYNYILKTEPISTLMPTLKKYFDETTKNQIKNLDKIDITKEGKYNFLGHTIYLYTHIGEDSWIFYELVKPNTTIIPNSELESIRKDIIDSYGKIKDFELFDLLNEKENPSTIYGYMLPIKWPKSETKEDYSIVNSIDMVHLAFIKNPKSMFHEIIESISNDKYSRKIGTIFANAASNIIDDNLECGTEHTFKDEDDKTNFNRAKNIARYLPHDQLEYFVTSLLEATENTGHTNFKDADPYDIILPYRDGRLFNPDN